MAWPMPPKPTMPQVLTADLAGQRVAAGQALYGAHEAIGGRRLPRCAITSPIARSATQSLNTSGVVLVAMPLGGPFFSRNSAIRVGMNLPGAGCSGDYALTSRITVLPWPRPSATWRKASLTSTSVNGC